MLTMIGIVSYLKQPECNIYNFLLGIWQIVEKIKATDF